MVTALKTVVTRDGTAAEGRSGSLHRGGQNRHGAESRGRRLCPNNSFPPSSAFSRRTIPNSASRSSWTSPKTGITAVWSPPRFQASPNAPPTIWTSRPTVSTEPALPQGQELKTVDRAPAVIRFRGDYGTAFTRMDCGSVRRPTTDGLARDAVRRVCTDSRQVQPGDLFFALAGERFDGHDFLAEVAGKGGAAAVVAAARTPASLRNCARHCRGQHPPGPGPSGGALPPGFRPARSSPSAVPTARPPPRN